MLLKQRNITFSFVSCNVAENKNNKKELLPCVQGFLAVPGAREGLGYPCCLYVQGNQWAPGVPLPQGYRADP